MKLKSIFFYQAVKIGNAMINSAHEDNYELSFEDGLAFIKCRKQNITVAIPTTNIPQMVVNTDKPQAYSNLEKARAAKQAKAEAQV